MASYRISPPLPTQVAATVGARLTLPATAHEEAVRGSRRQVRILRAPSLALLQELVTRELRAFAMSYLGEGRAARASADAAARAAVATQVLAALAAGDFRGAVVAHATGFGLGVELPPQLGGTVGDCLELPLPGSRRRAVAEETEPEAEDPAEDREPVAA